MRTAFVSPRGTGFAVKVFNSTTNHTQTTDTFEFKPEADRKKDFYNETFKKISAYVAERMKQDRLLTEREDTNV